MGYGVGYCIYYILVVKGVIMKKIFVMIFDMVDEVLLVFDDFIGKLEGLLC